MGSTTHIDEVVDGIYRIATWVPDAGITFNQFLIDDERPALIHTGVHQAYDGVRRAVAEVLDPSVVLPQVGQGALAVECRADDFELARSLSAVLDDPATRTAVVAERAVLATLEAGCSAPVGALAEVVSDLDDNGHAIDQVSLRAVVGTIDGALLRASVTGDMDDAEKLGAALAAELLDMGGLAALPRTAGSGVPR